MSNLIKYSFVDLRGKETKVIRHEKEEETFTPLETKKKVLMKTLEEYEQEKRELALKKEMEEEKSESGFEAGLPIENFDEVLEEKRIEAQKEADELIAKARLEAEKILKDAKIQAEQAREEARQQGYSDGYNEANALAQEEIDQLQTSLIEQKNAQEYEYQQLLNNTEGRYVEILCSLLRKLTGVILADKQDVILHLIRSGMADMEPARKYIVRVGSKDYLYVEANREDILNRTGIQGTLEIQEEKGLLEGECIIETDTQMIDCGYRTQLENMISTLRMLA